MLIASVLAVTGWGYLQMQDCIQYGEDLIQDCQTIQIAQLEANRALSIAEMEAYSRVDLEERLGRASVICDRLRFEADHAIMESEILNLLVVGKDEHIEILKEYIRDNYLPVPALPLIERPEPEPSPFFPFD
jgi:hypothetical protein